jgi:hypothetical protein
MDLTRGGLDPRARRDGLDQEASAIRKELKRSGYRDRFELVTRWAAEPHDLVAASRAAHDKQRSRRRGFVGSAFSALVVFAVIVAALAVMARQRAGEAEQSRRKAEASDHMPMMGSPVRPLAAMSKQIEIAGLKS